MAYHVLLQNYKSLVTTIYMYIMFSHAVNPQARIYIKERVSSRQRSLTYHKTSETNTINPQTISGIIHLKLFLHLLLSVLVSSKKTLYY